MSTAVSQSIKISKIMFSNQKPTTSGSELKLSYRFRKRAHEEWKPRSERQREMNHSGAFEALDLVNLFHELALFDDRIERINVKDMICQEFIDRIGKLYKPVMLMEQSSNANQVSVTERLNSFAAAKKIRCNDECSSKMNVNFTEHQLSNDKKSLLEYDAMSYFQKRMLKHCSEELLLPFSNFEDIVIGLAVPYLGEAFTRNESLNRILCKYINAMSKKTVLFDEDSEYDSDMSLGIFDTQKIKRRKLMSSCPIFK